MQFDIHHAVLDEFLRRAYDFQSPHSFPIIAVGGLTTIISSQAWKTLSPEEITLCVNQLRSVQIADESTETIDINNSCKLELSIENIRSNGSTFGRIAKIRKIRQICNVQSFEDYSLAAAEKTHLARALRATGGNRVRAAMLLQISRSSLYRKMEKYGLEIV